MEIPVLWYILHGRLVPRGLSRLSDDISDSGVL